MRVTQRTMYNNMMGSMQSTLTDYMESMTQGASQKRLNRPSDDPAGAARVLSYRASLTQTNQHVTNSDTAEGWLDLADKTLLSASTTIERIRVLAQEASTGSYDANQRMAMAKEIREHMGSLLNMANIKFEGKYIFAGEKYDNAPFQEGLATTIHNPGKLEGGTAPNLPRPDTQVTGTLPRSAMVRFSRDGTIPPAPGDDAMEYQWSVDGGKTWTVGTIEEDQNYFDVGGARVTVPAAPPHENNSMSVVQGYKLTEGDPTATPPVADTRSDPMLYEKGTTLEIRPTMIYQGSDNNATASVSRYGVIPLSPNIAFGATGNFPNDVLVRFDEEVEMTDEMLRAVPAVSFPYSYSTDGGSTWITGNKAAVTQEWDATQPAVVSPSTAPGNVTVSSTVKGNDVQVRLDNNVDPNDPTTLPATYSYSTDGGNTWVSGTPANATPVYGKPGITSGAAIPPDLKIESENLSANASIAFTDDPAVNIAVGATVNLTVDGVPATATFQDDGKGNRVAEVNTPTGKVTLTLPATKTGSLGGPNPADNTIALSANQTHNTVNLAVPGGEVKYSKPVGAPAGNIPQGSSYDVTAQGTATARLVLPGGFLDVKIGDRASGDTTIPKGAQLNLKPQRTSLDFEILENQFISVNNIGKDIFGGLFRPEGSQYLESAVGKDTGSNPFETIGRLIAACENNNQTEVGDCLKEIEGVQKNILYHTADIGGKMNRISTTKDVLEELKIDQSARMSAIEDVDFTELMIRLTQQQTAYNTVLKSSSMIMQLNLMKFM